MKTLFAVILQQFKNEKTIENKYKSYFEIPGKKMFDKEKIVAFAESQRLAFFDTATKVRRLNDDASDKFLEIIQPTDVLGMIGRMH